MHVKYVGPINDTHKINYKAGDPELELMGEPAWHQKVRTMVSSAMKYIWGGLKDSNLSLPEDPEALAEMSFMDLNPRKYIDKSHPDYTPSIYPDYNIPVREGVVGGTSPIKVVGKLPKYAQSINLTKQRIPRSHKELELKLAQKNVKTKQSWDKTGRLAVELMNDYHRQVKVLDKAKAGEGWTAVEAEAARRINVNGIHTLHEIASNPKINDATKQKLFDEFNEGIFKAVNQGTSEVGRALNIMKKDIAYTRLSKNISKLENGMSKEQWREFKNLDLDDPMQVKRFADRLDKPKLRDYIYEYWYNAILSGIPTHVVNVGSNTLWMTYQLPHRALTAIVDKGRNVLTGSARTRYINELVPMMGGMKTGAKRGVKAAKEVVSKGEITDFETKWAEEVGSALGAFERSPNPIVKKMGKYLTLPTKALRGMDVFGNSIAYDAEMAAIARRASNVKKLKGDKRKLFEQGFMKNPPQWAHDEAEEFAQYATFMSEPGKISKAIMQLRESFPGGRLIVPFVNTIGNLTKRGVEMVPGAGLMLAKGQNVSEVIAKQIEGSIITFMVMNKIASGEITGAAPDTEEQRERFYAQGKKGVVYKNGRQVVSISKN